MIHAFPKFKKIELSDKEEVEKLTRDFPPYSDFNFTSMWSWDIKNEMQISILNKNLVVRFTDYLTGEPFFSFIGENKVDETVEKLLELSNKEGLKIELKLVPEVSIKKIDTQKFSIEENRDHFDYILDIKSLATFKGKNFSSHRHHINQFKKKFSYEIVLIDKENLNKYDWSEISDFLKNITDKNDKDSVENEILAINKFGQIKNLHHQLSVIKIYSAEKLIGISICEKLDDKHVLGHFLKVDKSFSNSIMSNIIQETALVYKGVEHINIEQDLGILGLRSWKESFRPVSYLKKYKIVYN